MGTGVSPREIAQRFLVEGVATVDTPLSPRQVREAVAVLDRLLPPPAPEPGAPPRYRAGLTCAYYDEPLLAILQHPFFEEVSRAVLAAEEVRFFQTAIITAYPQPGAAWSYEQHVDIQYRTRHFEARPLAVVCSFFLWLTDVNERRAPMMLRPGSHRLLAAHNEQRDAGPDEVGVVRGVPLAALPALPYAEPVPLLARAGQCSVLTTSAVHGASTNVDDAPRKGLVLTFTAAGVKIGLPPAQEEQKLRYDAGLRERLDPGRRHLVDA